MTTVTIRVLGAVEVGDPSADRALGRGQARELLAFLVARRRHPATTAEIVDALWPDAPPATVATIVHGLVRRIRQSVGPEALLHDDAGYRLVLPDGAVDLWAVDALLADGAASEARHAWHDPAFGPYATRDWAQHATAAARDVLRPDPEVVGLLRTRLRVPVSRLVGRRLELTAVATACRRSRLVSIVGLGGVGKTRLALEAVRQLDHGQVIHVDVGAAVGHAASRLAVELGQPTSGDPVIDLRTTASRIGRSPRLLLLDGCEHDTAGSAQVVEFLLGSCPELTVIATSRTALGVPGEHVVPLLPFQDPHDLRGDAVELLLDRAHSKGLAVTSEDRERAADICRRCAGVPLAIELGVAELVFGAGPAAVAPGARSPEQAVTDVVAHALTQLSEPTAQAARRAAVLVAGFTPELAGALRPAGAAATGILHELVASGLVVAETSGTTRRLRFLDRVRDALEAQATVTDHAATLGAISAMFGAVRADLAEPLSVAHLTRAVAELANAQALLEQLRTGGRHETALTLATLVADTWAEDGHWASGGDQVAAAIEAAGDTDLLLRARAVRAWAAVVGTYEGNRRLTPHLLEALTTATEAGDLALEAHLRLHLTNAYGYGGQMAEAYEQVRLLGSLADRSGSEYLQIGAASVVAMGRLLTGDALGARTTFSDLARRVEGLGALSDSARLHRAASLACRALSDTAAALEQLEQAEQLAVQSHARGTLATVRTDIADLRVQQGDPAADAALDAALEASLAVGNLRAAGIVRTRLGELHEDPTTIALGVLDLWHTDRRWAGAGLATLLAALPVTHLLQTLGPDAIAALIDEWGTPLDASESARVAPYVKAAGTTRHHTDWSTEVEAHLTRLAT